MRAILLGVAVMLVTSSGCLGDGLSCDYSYATGHADLRYGKSMPLNDTVALLEPLGWSFRGQVEHVVSATKRDGAATPRAFDMTLSAYPDTIDIELGSPDEAENGLVAQQQLSGEVASIRTVLDSRLGAPTFERYVGGNPCHDGAVVMP